MTENLTDEQLEAMRVKAQREGYAYVEAAATELLALRAERANRPTAIVGQETIDKIRSGQAVELDAVTLIPASTFTYPPHAIAERAKLTQSDEAVDQAVLRLDVSECFTSGCIIHEADGQRSYCLMARASDLRALIADWRRLKMSLDDATSHLYEANERALILSGDLDAASIRAEGSAERAKLEAALRGIAGQPLDVELGDDGPWGSSHDFAEGYDQCIRTARAALAQPAESGATEPHDGPRANLHTPWVAPK